jgi:hypothetical protein
MLRTLNNFIRMNITFSIDQLEEVAQKIIAEKPNKIILSWRKWAWVKPH